MIAAIDQAGNAVEARTGRRRDVYSGGRHVDTGGDLAEPAGAHHRTVSGRLSLLRHVAPPNHDASRS